MAPLRRAPAANATRSAPYTGGGGESLLSRCRRARRAMLDGGDEEQPLEEHGVQVTTSALLHDDALAAVFARLRNDGPAVVRCAVASRRWARVVFQDAAALSRDLPPLGALALGFFHREDDGNNGRTGPFFVPTTSGSRLLGSTASSLLDGVHGIDLDRSRPVASRNGRLVLELPVREGSLGLCVCDPMTGAADVLPPLSGDDWPGGYYACALLTGDDVDPPVSYFRLLLVYNRRDFTALRRYASDTGSWGPEAKADLRISPEWLRHMAPATALRGVVYFSVDRHAFGVRLDGASASSHKLEQHIISYVTPKRFPVSTSRYSVTGVSPDGRLYKVAMYLVANKTVAVQTFSLRNEACNHDIFTKRWEEQEWSKAIRLDQFDVTRATAMACWWYSEKSRVLFFTLGEGSSVRGTFALNMETQALEKVADRDSWTNFCGYEMGREVYFKSLVVPP